MLRPLLDTNILLDVALGRPGLAETSGGVLAWCLDRPGTGLVTVHALATFSYLAGRTGGTGQARAFIADLVAGCDVAVIDRGAVQQALSLPLADFEDALVVAAANAAAATHIVTRNTRDFRRSSVPAIAPERFLGLAQAHD